MPIEIPLTRGKAALIDAEDRDLVCQYRWHAQGGPRGHFYARRRINLGNDRYAGVWMHRLIAGATDRWVLVDHINHDTLDNRRSNLRLCDSRQNAINRRIDNASGYRGVHRTLRGLFRATITTGRKNKNLGTFFDPVEAARAFDKAARALRGEFAVLNFPEES